MQNYFITYKCILDIKVNPDNIKKFLIVIKAATEEKSKGILKKNRYPYIFPKRIPRPYVQYSDE